MLVIGQSPRGDHWVVYKNAKGPVTPVMILKTEREVDRARKAHK